GTVTPPAAANQVDLRHCVSPRPGSANAPRSSYTTMGPARSTHHILAKVRDTVVPVSFLASRTRSAPEGVGKPVRRREDPRLVTGAGCYTDDVNLPGQAYAAMVRSPHAHARIVRIDTAPALATPGVLAVLTGADLVADGLKAFSHRPVPTNPHEVPLKSPDGSPFFVSDPLPLPVDRARFIGEPVAMVVAET